MAWPQRPAGGRARAHGGAGVAGGVGRLRPQARVAAPGRLGRAQDLGLDALAAGAAQDDGGRGHGDAAVRRGGDHACPSRRRVRRNAGCARSVMRIRSTRWCPVAIRKRVRPNDSWRRAAASRGPPRTAGARAPGNAPAAARCRGRRSRSRASAGPGPSRARRRRWSPGRRGRLVARAPGPPAPPAPGRPGQIRPPTRLASTRAAKGAAGAVAVAVQHSAQLREVKLAPPAGPLTSNDAPMGYLPVLTNLTHWPWFLNLVPKFFQPPFLH